ncbi:MAG: S-formylglutathione hydrolase [Pseudomonadales bacterium]
MEQIGANKCFGGEQRRYNHYAESLHCDMTFSVFLPPQASEQPVPVLYWLSGLTCSDENFVIKAGAQRYAAEHGIAIIAPDTSPRGDGVPDDPEAAYDFGLGAGFYLNATQAPYASHYKMYDYISEELPALATKELPIAADKNAISGHSMGGHGALTIAMKNPGRFKSASAFAPICSPTRCPWGQKALAGYLGEEQNQWQKYDASLLIAGVEERLPLLIDQGSADDFLVEQLKPELLVEAAEKNDYPLTYRLQEGYDHSYFFIATFIGEHIEFHARCLLAD